MTHHINLLSRGISDRQTGGQTDTNTVKKNLGTY